MADKESQKSPNVCDGFGNSVRLDESGLTVTASPNQDLNLVTSGSGQVKSNGTPIGGGGVTSFNARTGAVLPETDDYAYNQLSGAPVFVDAEVPTTFTTNEIYTLANTPNPLESLQVFVDDTTLGTDGCNKLLVQGVDYTLGAPNNTRINYESTIITNKIVCFYRM